MADAAVWADRSRALEGERLRAVDAKRWRVHACASRLARQNASLYIANCELERERDFYRGGCEQAVNELATVRAQLNLVRGGKAGV